jgi:hypothetical protein
MIVFILTAEVEPRPWVKKESVKTNKVFQVDINKTDIVSPEEKKGMEEKMEKLES